MLVLVFEFGVVWLLCICGWVFCCSVCVVVFVLVGGLGWCVWLCLCGCVVCCGVWLFCVDVLFFVVM
jgi:hypothetical protein